MRIDRICISLNNQCNLGCTYCHFHEKTSFVQENSMNVLQILDNVVDYIEAYRIPLFKIGFVGNGEPLLAYTQLKECIMHIDPYLQSGQIAAYTITNGTLINAENLTFLKEHKVTVGFSLDGFREIHDKLRCGTFDKVMQGIALYQSLYGTDPPLNCTVGREILTYAEETIAFFEQFSSRITFSRMIGRYGIPLHDFRFFWDMAEKRLHIRTGGYDCTMYGGLCGAGINNLFYANGCIYLCGNCIDIASEYPSGTPLEEIHFEMPDFDRHCCYKECVYSP